MQMLLLIALGIVSGTALIAGAIRLALYPPGIFKKPMMADPLDRPDQSDVSAVLITSSDAGGGGEGHA